MHNRKCACILGFQQEEKRIVLPVSHEGELFMLYNEVVEKFRK